MAAEQGQLMAIGTVASHNIANVLGLGEETVPHIEQAIRDEISAMSSHFTLAVADVQTHYEIETGKLHAEVEKIRSVFSFVEANKWRVLGVTIVVFSLGVITGHLV